MPNRAHDPIEVYHRVLEERAFQDSKYLPIEENPHDRGTWWLLIHAELEEARQALVKGGEGRNSFENELVQVAALCFAALEQHGLMGVEGKRRHIDD